MRQKMLVWWFCPLLLIGLLLAGCDAANTDGNVVGQIRLLLTDAPADAFREAHVTIRRVELIPADTEDDDTDPAVLVLLDEPRTFDLLQLQNGITAPLTEADIPAGTYRQLRLIVDEEAHVVLDDEAATEMTLKIPSGVSSGIKVLLPPFTVDEEDDLVTATIDFDLNDSFVKAGNSGTYIFKPVLRPIAFAVNGDVHDLGDE